MIFAYNALKIKLRDYGKEPLNLINNIIYGSSLGVSRAKFAANNLAYYCPGAVHMKLTLKLYLRVVTRNSSSRYTPHVLQITGKKKIRCAVTSIDDCEESAYKA